MVSAVSLELIFHKGNCAMTDARRTLPLPCPHCPARVAEVVVLTRTVISLTCVACGHGWSMHLSWLSEEALQMLSVGSPEGRSEKANA